MRFARPSEGGLERLDRDAKLFEQSGQWDAAIFWLDRLIRAEPGNGALRARRAVASANLNRWKLAATDLAKAAELEPGQAQPWYQLALAQLTLGDALAYRASCRGMLAHLEHS